ncbi:MAG: glycosyl hydrolase family 28-related protein [Candidatus Hinthialibacter antarcticus]|nr:glycosyl hydrolase family 28-related protein [Candidatus Hinthialibacter antarcticus]
MKLPLKPAALCLVFLTGILQPVLSAEHSALWGKAGELWSIDNRLPDVSYAGYHCGEKAIPTIKTVANVKDFGAIGDGKHDDSDAFQKALSQVESGAILVPNGKYLITNILEINRPGIVLRGESRDGAVLYCPKYLNDIKPNWGATTSGEKTSNYSWSGGIIVLKGNYQNKQLATVTQPAKRYDKWIQVSDAGSLKVGQWIEIRQKDTKQDTLAIHLYTNDPGKTEKILGRTRASLTTRIQKIDGNKVELERPLRFDIRAEWNPVVLQFKPSVTECGVENLTFEYPVTPYKGHFTELGYNPIALSDVVNCWVNNIRIQNADSGVFISGRYCTLQNILYESDRPADSRGDQGHHGIYISDDDNLFTHFNIQTSFIHDLTLSHCAGNVISNGKGKDLSFDHHKRVPYANVYTNIDAGLGAQVWRCGGGAALGKHCAGFGTFWNIRAQKTIQYPRKDFGPASMNLVFIQSDQKPITEKNGLWFETTNSNAVHPPNIHEAQLAKRLGKAN